MFVQGQTRHGGIPSLPLHVGARSPPPQRADPLTLVIGSFPTAHHGSDPSHLTVHAGHTAPGSYDFAGLTALMAWPC